MNKFDAVQLAKALEDAIKRTREVFRDIYEENPELRHYINPPDPTGVNGPFFGVDEE